MLEVIHISAECYPVAKVGGLADVVGALPHYISSSDVKSKVVMPFYNVNYTQNVETEVIITSQILINNREYDFKVLRDISHTLNFELYFIDLPELLYTNYVYSSEDTLRFIAFQTSVLKWLNISDVKPSVIHCHDHHTALIPFMMQYCFSFQKLSTIPSILTIHNAQYQGQFNHSQIDLLPDFDRVHLGLLDWDGYINPLACGIKCAWRVNTVSPSYMKELITHANRLESLLKHEEQKCIGILNGIDTQVWNPSTDSYLVKNFTPTQIKSGKKGNKDWLCNTYHLDKNKPLIVFIGRLVYEKGSDLFPNAFEQILKEHEVSILLLGSGDRQTEKELLALKQKGFADFNLHLGYDESLSHKMYAGADYLLMPSRVEPCGLNQLYALRYGTIPIVSHVGGLKDTVIDLSNNGYGIIMPEISVNGILNAVNRACKSYENTAQLNQTRKYIMQLDFSWNHAASQYIEMYKSLISEL